MITERKLLVWLRVIILSLLQMLKDVLYFRKANYEPTPIILQTAVTALVVHWEFPLGTITINPVSGGTPNYTYHITGVNGYDAQLNNQDGLCCISSC
jgi:hypothetical protein